METYVFKKESPRFYGSNYIVWKDRMKLNLKCLGDEYWKITKIVYNVP